MCCGFAAARWVLLMAYECCVCAESQTGIRQEDMAMDFESFVLFVLVFGLMSEEDILRCALHCACTHLCRARAASLCKSFIAMCVRRCV